MKPNFQYAIEFVLKWEGGYVNDPADPGGETKYGISKAAHPDEDIKNLTLERAVEIYKRDYWDSHRLDQFDLPMCVALMDSFVQHPPRVVYKLLIQSGDSNWQEFIRLRRLFYLKLLTDKPEMLKFKNGWMNRLNDLDKYCTIIEQEKEKAGV